MSTDTPAGEGRLARDPAEEARSSTSLELLFDLCFVVAVAAAAAGLHASLSSGRLSGFAWYAAVFFATWWAWMNFSWYASAYDTDDGPYRTGAFVIMTGVLILAAGNPAAAGPAHDFRLVVAGYVVMRLAFVPLWLRAARLDPPRYRTARLYAIGIFLLQLCWVAQVMFVTGSGRWIAFGLLIVAELSVPVLAESIARTPWHPGHIVERYSGFTTIVLGEVILATTLTVSAGLHSHGSSVDLVMAVVGSLQVVFAVWWFYFQVPVDDLLDERTAFFFGYVHFLVFAAVAAVGSALNTAVDLMPGGSGTASARFAAMVLAGSLATYVLSLGTIHAVGHRSVRVMAPGVVLTMGVLAAGFVGSTTGRVGPAVLLVGTVCTLVIAVLKLLSRPRSD